MLLDEPTNHLDLDAIVWLEEWLTSTDSTLLMISHDREFLDAIINRVLHIENKTIRAYSGNYSQFEQKRAEELALQQALEGAASAPGRGNHILRGSISRQGEQVAPGPEPPENASEDGAHRAGACRQSVRVRICQRR